jgi:transmembrane sensor
MDRRALNQIAEEAGFWDARLRAPDCSDSDRARFATWRDQDPCHCAEFERLQLIAATARQEITRADVRALRDAALRAGGARRWNTPLATAAALTVLALGVGVWIEHPEFSLTAPIRHLLSFVRGPGSEEVGERYMTQVGQRSTVTLRDGSTVELNAKTLITVAFTPTQRSIELVDGQALFHVAKNAQRPFVVRAGDREILAIGTAFDVRRDASSVRVTLVEGRVAVSREPADPAASPGSHQMLAAELASKSPPGSSSSNRPQAVPLPTGHVESAVVAEVFLEPGQQLLAQAASGESVVQSVDVQKVIGWRDGRVTLEDSSLADAVTEMNRHSPVQIRLQSRQLAALRVNGVFRAGEQEAFVTALESYFPIVVQRRGDAEIVLTAR